MRCCTSWRTVLPRNLAGLKTAFMMASFAGSSNAWCVDLSTLKEAGSACPVVSTMYWTSTEPAMPALCRTGGYRGVGIEMGETGSSSSASVNTSAFTSTGPVPPTTPVPTPPSTPLPVKSFGSKAFCFRSMGGMSLGMSVGATTVWKPFGGGFASTTCSGGGGGGGASGGLRNTMVVSTGLSLVLSATPWVALTAAKMISPCTRTDPAVCPRRRCFFALDSSRFSNTRRPPSHGSGRAEDTAASMARQLTEDDNSMTRGLDVGSLGPPAVPRQPDREQGPPPRTALHRDGAPVRLRDPFGDRQPEARAGPLAGPGAGGVGAPEAVEDVREITGRDAD